MLGVECRAAGLRSRARVGGLGFRAWGFKFGQFSNVVRKQTHGSSPCRAK